MAEGDVTPADVDLDYGTDSGGGGMKDWIATHKWQTAGGVVVLGLFGLYLYKRHQANAAAASGSTTTPGQGVASGQIYEVAPGSLGSSDGTSDGAFASLIALDQSLQNQIATLTAQHNTVPGAPMQPVGKPVPTSSYTPATGKTPVTYPPNQYYALSPAAASNALNNLGYTLYQTGAEAMAWDKAHGVKDPAGINPGGFYALSPQAAKAGLASGMTEYQTSAEANQWAAAHK